MAFNLATILRESRLVASDRPLCHFGDATFTYAQVDEISGRVAATLSGLGLRRGDRVAIQLPNLPQFLFAYFGILKAGLVAVPLNPLLRAPEIVYHLSDAGASVLITFELFAEEAARGAHDAGDVSVFVVQQPGSDRRPDGTRCFDDLYAAEDSGDIVQTSADDVAVLLYTSGTTGSPKGAQLTHFQLYMNCTVAGDLFGFRPDDVSLAVLPLFHVFGMSSVLNTAIRYGATLVLVPKFEPEAVLEAIERHHCTLFYGVPTMYFALLHHDRTDRDLTSLRIGVSGGAAIPGEVIRGFEAAFPGVVILEGYGLSETASAATFNISARQRKVGSAGKAIWGVQVAIIDAKDVTLPPGPDHVGEIVIRGHNIMKGYHQRPEATSAALRDDWFRTGDLGYLDEDGYLFIVDRIKDLIIRGGYNVYPREVEEVLFTHPAVAEAAVIGRPDERLGEEVVACITLEPGVEETGVEQEILSHCRDHLAAYKCPREVRILEALPLGPTGKILKRELR